MRNPKEQLSFPGYCKSKLHTMLFLFREDWFRTVFCLSLTFFLPEYLAIGSVFLSALFLVRTMRKEQLRLKFGWLGILLALYILSGFISCFYALRPIHSLLMSSLWAAMMIGYFAFTTILTDKSRLRITLKTFMVFGFICGIISIFQYVLNLFGDFPNIRNLWYSLDTYLYETFSSTSFYTYWRGNRTAATFSNPNLYAMEILLILPFGLYCLNTTNNKNARILHSILLAVTFIGVLFAFCRSFYFAIIPMVLAFLILTFAKSRISRWGLLFLFVGLALFKLIPNPIWERFTDLNFGESSISKRFDAWIVALRAFREQPVGGYGFGNLNILQLLHQNGVDTHHMHNLPFELLAEGGLIAIVIFAAMAWNIFVPGIKMHRIKDNHDSILGATILVITAGFLLFSMAQFPMTTPKSIILFILMYGIFDASGNLCNTSRTFKFHKKSTSF